MEWAEVIDARLIGAPLMVLTARPYGVWRDHVMALGPRRGIPPLACDTAALLSFQVPLYTAIIWAGGAQGSELLKGAAGATAMMLALGRPYGVFLDFVRSLFGLPPGGQKPMSLGG